jgi:glycosyltransferase involved in cell wall biosynthesis
MKSKVAVVIICYNNPRLLTPQIKLLRKYCTDKPKIIVVDNSTDQEAIDAIEYYCKQLKVRRIKTKASSHNGSDSHSFAANVSYLMLKDKFDYFLYLDHDCFPVKPFSIVETLGKNLFAGIGQQKSKLYLWPGCFMFKTMEGIDFSPSHEFGLDTGGNLYKLIEANPNKTLFFDEVYEQNPGYNKSIYSFYAMINKGTFCHFINGSNWNYQETNEERINSLLNILEYKTK